MDRKIDKKLNIMTEGFREWDKKQSINYNRTESTPYESLNILLKSYKINKNDKFIDFGCGKGRVSFYINSLYDIETIGIELNELTYDDLIENSISYNKYNRENKNFPVFIKTYAEKYNIKDNENIFYFFNPFSLKIFSKVIDNILLSIENHPREVDIILYYPLEPYLKFLDTKTNFTKINTIKISGKQDKDKKFIIYKYILDKE